MSRNRKRHWGLTPRQKMSEEKGQLEQFAPVLEDDGPNIFALLGIAAFDLLEQQLACFRERSRPKAYEQHRPK